MRAPRQPTARSRICSELDSMRLWTLVQSGVVDQNCRESAPTTVRELSDSKSRTVLPSTV